MENKNEEYMEIDLFKLLNALLKKWKFIAFTSVFMAIIFFLVNNFLVTPLYKASVKLYVNNNKTALSDNLNYSDINASTMIIPTYTQLFSSQTVLQTVADKLGNKYTTDDLAAMMDITSADETQIISLNITYSDPEIALIVANAIADNAPEKITDIMGGGSIKVVDYAKLPESPCSPNVSKNTLLGFVIGLILSIGLVIITELTDTRIKDADDLKNQYEDIPILGTIPEIRISED